MPSVARFLSHLDSFTLLILLLMYFAAFAIRYSNFHPMRPSQWWWKRVRERFSSIFIDKAEYLFIFCQHFFSLALPLSCGFSCSHALSVFYFEPLAFNDGTAREIVKRNTNRRTEFVCVDVFLKKKEKETRINDKPNCSENQHHWTGNNNNHF